jgi:mycothiol system anti-sigma-R factor
MSFGACNSLLDNLYQLLDGELSPDQVDHFQSHLEECSECLERLGVELHFTLLVRGRCSQEKVPPQVIERIRYALQSEVNP